MKDFRKAQMKLALFLEIEAEPKKKSAKKCGHQKCGGKTYFR